MREQIMKCDPDFENWSFQHNIAGSENAIFEYDITAGATGEAYYSARWSRALSKEEVEQLDKDPYCFLIFTRPTSWLRMMFDRFRWRLGGFISSMVTYWRFGRDDDDIE